MTIKRILLCGAAVVGIFAGTAQAQTSAPESILPPSPEKVERPMPDSNGDAPATSAPKRAQNVDEAFGVKLGDAAKVFGKKFACGASVTKNPSEKEQIETKKKLIR